MVTVTLEKAAAQDDEISPRGTNIAIVATVIEATVTEATEVTEMTGGAAVRAPPDTLRDATMR